jgi:hypothetical protein
MSQRDGGPAFPNPGLADANCSFKSDVTGLTVRDYFAAHAPQPGEMDIAFQMKLDQNRNPHNDGPPKPPRRSRDEIVGALRYAYADGMIAARGKP